jgi:hypothetical protein
MASVNDQMKRLYLARWLTRQAAAAAGGPVPRDASRQSMEDLALRLGDNVGGKTPLTGLRFEPPYPGRAVQESGAVASARLVLSCTAVTAGAPLGVVFTVLISGRRPEVSVAPASATPPHADDKDP